MGTILDILEKELYASWSGSKVTAIQVAGAKGALSEHTLLDFATSNPGKVGYYFANVKEGGRFTVRMDANPTTGFKWMVRPDEGEGCLAGMKSSYKMDDDPKKEGWVGVGGKSTFEYNVVGDTGCS